MTAPVSEEINDLASKHGFTLGHLRQIAGPELLQILRRYDLLCAEDTFSRIEADEIARTKPLDDEALKTILASPNFRDYEKVMARELLTLRQARAGEQWQPIETAPRDGTELLGLFPYYTSAIEGGSVWVMRWNDEKFRPNPKPHFEASGWVWGVQDQRRKQPTHWRPLPPPPFRPDSDSGGSSGG